MDTSHQTSNRAEDGPTYLTDDLSRQDLFARIREANISTVAERTGEGQHILNLYGPFRFPNDAEYDVVLQKPRVDAIFGADISHHTSSAFPIDELKLRKLDFLYMKASQSTRFVDPKFARFWAEAGRLPRGSQVHRGAYHFLSCGDPAVSADDWGRAQGQAFVKVIRANGGLLPTDMPPVVDLEWDIEPNTGADRWQSRSADDIIKLGLACLSTVEAELDRIPMVYTSATWWNERIGSSDGLSAHSRYLLWIADYSKKSRASEVPRTIGNAPWALWQFTDRAQMAAGFKPGFDASIFKGKATDFYTRFGVAEFG